MNSSARFLAAALLAAWLPAPGVEALLPTGAEPRYHIQAIEVRGNKYVSSSVVASESLIEPGGVYTESDLSAAVGRIRRLPFIRDVEIALRKGRQRGAFVLLVDVLETKRYFYQLDLVHNELNQPLSFEPDEELDDSVSPGLTVGARTFVGRYGMVFAAASHESAQVGFARYNLFGRGAVLSAGVSAGFEGATRITSLGLDPSFSSWADDRSATRASVSLSVPMDAYQAVLASLSWRRSGKGTRLPALSQSALSQSALSQSALSQSRSGPEEDVHLAYEGRTEQEVRLAWHRDTTDDPIFPFEGTSLAVALDYRTLRADFTSSQMSSELLRLSVHGRRHWPVARRQTLGAGLSLAAGRGSVDEKLKSWELTATIRHTLSLNVPKTARDVREVYWQNTLEYSADGVSSHSTRIAAIGTSIVLRHAWGLLRLGLRWIDVRSV